MYELSLLSSRCITLAGIQIVWGLSGLSAFVELSMALVAASLQPRSLLTATASIYSSAEYGELSDCEADAHCHFVAAAYGDQAHEVTRIAEQQKLGKRLVRPKLVAMVWKPHQGTLSCC